MKTKRQAKILELIRRNDIETQEELAERLFVTRQTVSNYENGVSLR